MTKLCADYLLLQSWWHYHHFVTEKLKHMGTKYFCSSLISYLCCMQVNYPRHIQGGVLKNSKRTLEVLGSLQYLAIQRSGACQRKISGYPYGSNPEGRKKSDNN